MRDEGPCTKQEPPAVPLSLPPQRAAARHGRRFLAKARTTLPLTAEHRPRLPALLLTEGNSARLLEGQYTKAAALPCTSRQLSCGGGPPPSAQSLCFLPVIAFETLPANMAGFAFGLLYQLTWGLVKPLFCKSLPLPCTACVPPQHMVSLFTIT